MTHPLFDPSPVARAIRDLLSFSLGSADLSRLQE